MPEVPEAAVAVGAVVDDVHAGDARQVVDVDMVVGHLHAVFLGEVAAEAQALGGVPDFLDLRGGGALREAFAVEGGAPSAHHVQQDAVAGVVALHVGHAAPVLRAEAPGVGLVGSLVEGGDAVVLGVEEDDVHADGRGLLLHLPGHLQQDAHAAGTVVGAEDGLFLFLLAALGVGVWAAVPVGAEQDAAAVVGIEGADDVAGLEDGVVVGHEVGLLHMDGGAELPELADEVVAAGTVGSGVGHARAEVHLLLDVTVGAVGIEGGHDDGGGNGFLRTVLVDGLFTVAAARHDGHGYQAQGSDEGIISFHCYLKLSFTCFFGDSS